MVISFCPDNPQCKWNVKMAQMIFALWEMSQLHAIQLPYNRSTGDLSRVYTMLADYRMSCKYIHNCIRKIFYENYGLFHTNKFLVTTIMYFLRNYMLPANNRGFEGYRARAEYTTGSKNILTANSSRPQDYVLSIFYTHEQVPGYKDASNAATSDNAFPGRH